MLCRMTMRALVAGFIALVLAGCSSSVAESGSPPATMAAPSKTATLATFPTVRFDGHIAVSGGRSLAVRCLGTGSPTILLEGGGTRAWMGQWGTAFPTSLARLATVCTYSHAGHGSSPASEPITWAGVLGDADAVLAGVRAKAGINGPYLFVGWSFGGEVALGEAVEDLSRTAGLVILDTDFPVDFIPTCEATGESKADCQADYNSDLEAKRIEDDLVKTIKPLPNIPIELVSAIRPPYDCAVAPGASALTQNIETKVISAPDCKALLRAIADYDLTQWRSLGPQVGQTLVDADHDGLIDLAGPQIVDVITGVLAQVH